MSRTMGLIAESELTEIELMIQKSRLDHHSEQLNSGRLRVCVKTKPGFEPPPDLLLTDGFIQMFQGEVFVVKPFSYRCTIWMRENLSSHETPEGFRFDSKEDFGKTAEGGFSYRLIDDQGFPL